MSRLSACVHALTARLAGAILALYAAAFVVNAATMLPVA